jgi:glycosyltransferase involved in cell wall biosynthesis
MDGSENRCASISAQESTHQTLTRASLRIGILQKRLQPFRIPVFRRLAARPGVELRILTGENFASSSTAELLDIRVLRTMEAGFAGGRAILHPGVVKHIHSLDVLVVEGSLRILTSILVVATRRLHGVPVVWWTSLHEPKVGRVSVPSGVKLLVLKAILKRADAVACYSSVATAELRNGGYVENHQLFLAPNVLDTDVLRAAEEPWIRAPSTLAEFKRKRSFQGRAVVLFVGTLTAKKRLSDLLIAFSSLRRDESSLRPMLAIVGDGPERAKLERLAQTLAPSDDIRFFGEIKDVDAICPYFLSSRVLALPGAGGLALYQALAHGLPVVTSSADGTEDDLVQEGVNGLFFSRGDVVDLARAIRAILSWPTDRWSRASGESRRVAQDDAHVDGMIDGLLSAAIHAHRQGAQA